MSTDQLRSHVSVRQAATCFYTCCARRGYSQYKEVRNPQIYMWLLLYCTCRSDESAAEVNTNILLTARTFWKSFIISCVGRDGASRDKVEFCSRDHINYIRQKEDNLSSCGTSMLLDRFRSEDGGWCSIFWICEVESSRFRRELDKLSERGFLFCLLWLLSIWTN